MRLDAVALVVLLVVTLLLMYRSNRTAVRTERAAMFDACLPMLERYRLVQDDVNFPVLDATYQGRTVRVEAVADHVGFRKVPSLWLLVTVRGELPLGGILDLLARPQNIEFFSPAGDLPLRLQVPTEWPAHTLIKADRAEAGSVLPCLEPHVLELFSDPRSKELLVTPRGVRIVYQANQVERGEYLVLRALKFRNVAVDPELLGALLDRAIAIGTDVECAERCSTVRRHEEAA